MDDIKEDTPSEPRPKRRFRIVSPESESRGGRESLPQDEDLSEHHPWSQYVRTIRRICGMTQRQFAKTFRIPFEIIIAWENEGVEPTITERQYLRLIAGDREAVQTIHRKVDEHFKKV
jgi:DNA-binding transcriptional regulator YiaG